MIRRLLCMLVLAFGLALADEVRLADGSVVKGKILSVWGGNVRIETGFAGVLSIDGKKIRSMSTDEAVMVIKSATGSATSQAIAGVGGSDLAGVWRVGDADPRLPKPRKWAYEASLDLTGKTGNSEKCDFGGGVNATLQGPSDKLRLFARGRYGKENGTKNEEEFIAGADFERMFGDTDSSWYLRSQFEHDEIDNYDRYYTNALGYGYYLVKRDDLEVRLRLGLNHMRKEYVDGHDKEDGMGMDFNYHHEIKLQNVFGIKDLGRLVTDVTYTPTVEDWERDYRIYHESAIDIPLGNSGNWKIRLGVSNEYNNFVVRGTDRLDTTYFGRLVFQWK